MKDLIDSWVKATELSQNNPGFSANNWAIQKILDMNMEGEHDEVWKIILGIVSATESDWVVGCLGAGPLEDLLVYQAPEFIERIAIETETSPKFKRALSSVCLDADDTPLYKRVYEIAGVDPPFD